VPLGGLFLSALMGCGILQEPTSKPTTLFYKESGRPLEQTLLVGASNVREIPSAKPEKKMAEEEASREIPPIEEMAQVETAPPISAKDQLRPQLADLEDTASEEEVIPPEPDFMDLSLNKKSQACLSFLLAQERRSRVARILLRSEMYVPVIQQYLREEGVPEELAYLVGVESGFTAHARSRAGAVGWWQFMAPTGRKYGLRIDWWIDERQDLEKSTRAAARYLRDLFKMFGDWKLAMAAYNCGENGVARAIKKQGTRDYVSLHLPRETRNFVPSYLAMRHLCRHRERYEFPKTGAKPPSWVKVRVGSSVDLRVIAECSGSSYEDIKDLNRELLRWCTPPDYKEYRVAIPLQGHPGFQEKLAKTTTASGLKWIKHRVSPGESLSVIASHYGIPMREIAQLNSVRNCNRISVGDILLIPTKPGQYEEAPRELKMASESHHAVRPGENLWTIAKRYGVSSSSLAAANGIEEGQLIFPGDRLSIPGVTSIRKAAASKERKEPEVRTYTVRKGDTIWRIAKLSRTTVREIQRANNLSSTGLIRPGDVLKIPIRNQQ